MHHRKRGHAPWTFLKRLAFNELRISTKKLFEQKSFILNIEGSLCLFDYTHFYGFSKSKFSLFFRQFSDKTRWIFHFFSSFCATSYLISKLEIVRQLHLTEISVIFQVESKEITMLFYLKTLVCTGDLANGVLWYNYFWSAMI